MIIRMHPKEFGKIFDHIKSNKKFTTLFFCQEDNSLGVINDNNNESISLLLESVKDPDMSNAYGIPTNSIIEILPSLKLHKEDKPIEIIFDTREITFKGKLFLFRLKISEIINEFQKRIKNKSDDEESRMPEGLRKYWVVKKPSA